MTKIKFDWESGINEVCTKLKNKKLIGVQIPDGLKVKSHQIIEKIKELTNVRINY